MINNMTQRERAKRRNEIMAAFEEGSVFDADASHLPQIALPLRFLRAYKNMTPAQSDFKKWFVNSLKDLRDNGNTGFIFALVAFPLLERYLRNKSRCPEGQELTRAFFDNLGQSIKEVLGMEY
jgi:hypothetical protein